MSSRKLNLRLPMKPIQLAAHAGALVPLALLAWDFFTNNLTYNPIQAATQRTGLTAIVLLLLSLACTPLYTLTGFAPLLNLRRPFGLYAFLYVSIHLSIFFAWDYAFDWDLILKTISEKPYIVAGLSAFLLLSPLAFTSYQYWMKRMGKNWKRLHRLVYLAGGLAVLHFAWGVKGNFTQIQGDVGKPLLAAIVLSILFFLRIPAVRKKIRSLRRRSRPGQAVVVRRKVSAPTPAEPYQDQK
ncbi:MAG: protein-methionine-sulfoxide reductase heme-binding subunit MsrQ [Anaerolineaceae bacterium]|nr:protein-methionine-sulfoxide reductase heme-binding subunit MsrQ [Anaerolineaceae bacterium]